MYDLVDPIFNAIKSLEYLKDKARASVIKALLI